MGTYGIEQHVGEIIRQTRRQRNLTQSELGGLHYSKSYVSAVERNKISPSTEALQFFAQQLDQPDDYFTAFSQQAVSLKQLAILHGSSPRDELSQALEDEELTFLDIMLDSVDHYHFETLHELPALSPEIIATFPMLKQARYYFLIGMIAKKRREYSAALHAFECALTLAPAKHQPAILDELGHTYYQTNDYHTALSYHSRSLNLLQSASSNLTGTPLQFKVELHCGDDCFALGAYKQACDYYELARSHMNAERDMKTAALLYLSLGYCIYALNWQKAAQATPENKKAALEEMEIQLQRAISFLVQSRSLCQVSYDHMGEARARLASALTELDMSTRKRFLAQEEIQGEGKEYTATCASLLDDAEEQCRQVLLGLQDSTVNSDTSSANVDVMIYLALAYLIRVFTQRSILARLGKYQDTSLRERSLASFLCEQVIDTFYENSFPQSMIGRVLFLQDNSLVYRVPALPGFPDLGDDAKKVLSSPISHVEVYLAVGEFAEELGRVASSPDYAFDCYTRANQFYQEALKLAHTVVSRGDREPGYLTNCYQRCICLLEERSTASPDLWQESAGAMLDLFKKGLYQFQDAVLSVQVKS